jgi:hypothetical protein
MGLEIIKKHHLTRMLMTSSSPLWFISWRKYS